MRSFSREQLEKLNKESQSGVFFQAAVFERRTLALGATFHIHSSVSGLTNHPYLVDPDRRYAYFNTSPDNKITKVDLLTGAAVVSDRVFYERRALDEAGHLYAVNGTGIFTTIFKVYRINTVDLTIAQEKEGDCGAQDIEGFFMAADQSCGSEGVYLWVIASRGIGSAQVVCFRKSNLQQLFVIDPFASYNTKPDGIVVDKDGFAWTVGGNQVGFPASDTTKILKIDPVTQAVVGDWDVTATVGDNSAGMCYDEVSHSLIFSTGGNSWRWDITTEAFVDTVAARISMYPYKGKAWDYEVKPANEYDLSTFNITRTVDINAISGHPASIFDNSLYNPMAYVPGLDAVIGFYHTTGYDQIPLDPSNVLGGVEYWADFQRPFSFEGHIYNTLPMEASGGGAQSSMELPIVDLTVPNLEDAVIDYLEEKRLLMIRSKVWLQILHMDPDGTVTKFDEQQLLIMLMNYDHARATFHLGVPFTLDDPVPRQTIEKNEFPAIRDDVIRVGT